METKITNISFGKGFAPRLKVRKFSNKISQKERLNDLPTINKKLLNKMTGKQKLEAVENPTNTSKTISNTKWEYYCDKGWEYYCR